MKKIKPTNVAATTINTARNMTDKPTPRPTALLADPTFEVDNPEIDATKSVVLVFNCVELSIIQT